MNLQCNEKLFVTPYYIQGLDKILETYSEFCIKFKKYQIIHISKKIKVKDLVDFLREQIVGVCIAGATIMELSEILLRSRGTVLKMLKIYEKKE